MKFDYLCGFLSKYISLVRAECCEYFKPEQRSRWSSENSFLCLWPTGEWSASTTAMWSSFWGCSDFSHLMFLLPCALDSLISVFSICSVNASLSDVLVLKRRQQKYMILVICSAVLVNTSTSCLKRWFVLFVSAHHLLCHQELWGRGV